MYYNLMQLIATTAATGFLPMSSTNCKLLFGTTNAKKVFISDLSEN